MRKLPLMLSAIALVGLIPAGCVILEPVTISRPRPSAVELDDITVGHNDSVSLLSRTYTGTLRVRANSATITGAGTGRTIIRGDVVIQGNANTVTGVTVIGSVSVSGNANDLQGSDLSRAEVTIRGQANRY